MMDVTREEKENAAAANAGGAKTMEESGGPAADNYGDLIVG